MIVFRYPISINFNRHVLLLPNIFIFFVVLNSLVFGADLSGKPNCEQIASTVEKESNLPPHILSSISRVEAGRKLSTGNVRGWPWTLNHAGKGLFFDSKEQALKYLKQAVSSGSRNIDVGCMQLNYRWHKVAFSSIDEMMDPELNIKYAAQFVHELYGRHKNWEDAIKHYHSNKKKFNVPYFQKVAKVWDLKKVESIDSNPLMFTDAEEIEPLIETKQENIPSIKPLVVFDAAVYPLENDQTLIPNTQGINFISNSTKKSEIASAPINVPGYLRKHWSLVISLREQLETN